MRLEFWAKINVKDKWCTIKISSFIVPFVINGMGLSFISRKLNAQQRSTCPAIAQVFAVSLPMYFQMHRNVLIFHADDSHEGDSG